MGTLRLEVSRDPNEHVKKTLPPSLTGFPGQAEIKYYVKATVVRPQFYKENYRDVRLFFTQFFQIKYFYEMRTDLYFPSS